MFGFMQKDYSTFSNFLSLCLFLSKNYNFKAMKSRHYLLFGFILMIVSPSIFAQQVLKPIHFSKWIKSNSNNDSLNNLSRNKIPLAFFMNEESDEVKQYEKLEIGLKLPQELNEQIKVFLRGGRGLNPFNPEQVRIKALFLLDNHVTEANQGPNYNREEKHIIREGFYYEEFNHDNDNPRFKHGDWKKDTSSFDFRIRFAPPYIGNWICNIEIYINNELYHRCDTFSFTCKSKKSNGFINSISENSRLLKFENGEIFFGIGQNIPTADLNNAVLPNGMSKFREQPPKGFELQREYISDLSANGGNLIRIFNNEWADAVEWEKLNDYSMNMKFAWEFDRTLDLCKEKNIFILWVQQYHSSLMYHNPYGNDNLSWQASPYHLELGIEKPEEFFTNEEAIKYYKRKIRYIMSRWGYSTQIAGIQPINEINEVASDFSPDHPHHPYFHDPEFRKSVGTWFQEIKNYIQNELDYPFLVGSSYTGDVGAHVQDDPIMRIADFNDYHPYGQNRNRNIGARFGGINITPGYGIFKRYQKPIIIGEMGTWDTEFLNECHENEFHNDIWGTAFLGGWSTGLHWHNWEDNYNKNLRENFVGISKFMSRVNFTDKNYQPKRWPEKDINAKNYSNQKNDYFENLYLVNKKNKKQSALAIGWVHNRSAYWYNYPETECEKNLTNKKTNESKGKEYYKPGDDDEIGFTKYEGDSNKKKRVTRIKGLSKFRKYNIYWVNTETGEKIVESQKFFWFGKFKINIPNEINSTTYQDLGYYIYYNNHKFAQP